MPKNVILIAEDDRTMREFIRASLPESEYEFILATNGTRLMEIVKTHALDMILLDIMLPDGNGLDLVTPIRDITNIPIIILSGKNRLEDKIRGFDEEIDDYIAKPFHPAELCARVAMNIRRYQNLNPSRKAVSIEAASQIRFKEWILDRDRYCAVNQNDQNAELTLQEFKLLETLVLEAGRTLRRDDLSNAVSITDDEIIHDRAIDISIARIRKKLGDDAKSPSLIKTVRGVGYMMPCSTEIIK